MSQVCSRSQTSRDVDLSSRQSLDSGPIRLHRIGAAEFEFAHAENSIQFDTFAVE
jgi:hypothetical protein